MTKIVKGKKIARDIIREMKAEVENKKLTPRIDIFICAPNGAIESFVARKRRSAKRIGVQFVEHHLHESITTEEIQAQVSALHHKTNGIVIQLPMPEHIDTEKIINALPTTIDVDVLGEKTFTQFIQQQTPFEPPVAGAIREILERHSIETHSKKAVVVGKGKLVGLPTIIVLERLGCHVFAADSDTPTSEVAFHLKEADIIVSGTGVANLITPEKIKDGVVLLDAGTSGNKAVLAGDISYDCEDKATLFSKTPGGIGPITVAILYKNLIRATVQQHTD